MGAAGPLMPTEDRWAVIAYLRALAIELAGNDQRFDGGSVRRAEIT
jgi:hypothetical protein